MIYLMTFLLKTYFAARRLTLADSSYRYVQLWNGTNQALLSWSSIPPAQNCIAIETHSLLRKIKELDSITYKDSTKAIRESLSLVDICWTASREASASPPCQRIASKMPLALPSWRKFVWPLTVLISPIPHNGGVRHSEPSARKSGRLSANPGPMSCSSRSVYG